ncbi:MAG TPA: 2-C-methyl-D-erythritol 4-phosphate cytidylyltransferase [Streptosporangiaceae bacterium]|nr:2-C-methyl-D-erythritol 4-phosphate cytidylyltransferase [Streptosporangiaceae bacterium]
MRTVAVVLAAGSGQRFGAAVPKQLLPLAGRALLEHSVAAFEQAPGVSEILVVVGPGHTGQVRDLLAGRGYRKVTGIIEGGVTRPESTRRAIAELGSQECDVLFHDAARPLLDQRTIADCVRALRDHQAVGVVVPTSDTIVVVQDAIMTGMPPRDTLRRCQTPQGFRLSVIRKAHELALADPAAADLPATDDCGVVLRYLPEVPVAVVPGSERNIKITYPGDLDIAETLLSGGQLGDAEISGGGR